MPVPIMLAITMEVAVKKPTVRRGDGDFTERRFGGRSHLWIDNPEIIGTREFFRSGVRIHNWRASLRDTLVAVGKFAVA